MACKVLFAWSTTYWSYQRQRQSMILISLLYLRVFSKLESPSVRQNVNLQDQHSLLWVHHWQWRHLSRPSQNRGAWSYATWQNVVDVHRFLGMTTQLSQFTPNLTTLSQPLWDLLKKNNLWCWNDAQQAAFDLIKAELSSPVVLALYNPSYPTQFAADAPSFSLGVSNITIATDWIMATCYLPIMLDGTNGATLFSNKEGSISPHVGVWALQSIFIGTDISHPDSPQAPRSTAQH